MSRGSWLWEAHSVVFKVSGGWRLEGFGVGGLELGSSGFEVWKFGEFGSFNGLVFSRLEVCALEITPSTLDQRWVGG